MKRNLRLEFLLTIKKPLRIKGFFWLSTDSETALKLIYAIFQALTRFEAGDLRSSDADRIAGLRVAASAGGAFFHFEGAETHQRNGVTCLEGAGNGVDEGIQGASGGSFRQVGLRGDGVDQFSLIHGASLWGGALIEVSQSLTSQKWPSSLRRRPR